MVESLLLLTQGLTPDEFSQAAPSLVGKNVSVEKVDGTTAIGMLVAVTEKSVIIRLSNDKLLEITAGDLEKIEPASEQQDPVDAAKQYAPTAPPAPVKEEPTQRKIVDQEKVDSRTAEKRADEKRRRMYRAEADDLRAQAAAERATAGNQMTSGVGACAGSAAMAVGSLFVCGIPLLIGSAVSGVTGAYFLIAANNSNASAATKEQIAEQKNRAARDGMEY